MTHGVRDIGDPYNIPGLTIPESFLFLNLQNRITPTFGEKTLYMSLLVKVAEATDSPIPFGAGYDPDLYGPAQFVHATETMTLQDLRQLRRSASSDEDSE